MIGHKASELIALSEDFELRSLMASNPLERAQWEVMAQDYREQALRCMTDAAPEPQSEPAEPA